MHSSARQPMSKLQILSSPGARAAAATFRYARAVTANIPDGLTRKPVVVQPNPPATEAA
jgi:hypothetical protein